MDQDNLIFASPVIALRSAGADGVFEGDAYAFGTFPANDCEHDTVWATGFFVQFPDGVHQLIFSDTFETGDIWGTRSECASSP